MDLEKLHTPTQTKTNPVQYNTTQSSLLQQTPTIITSMNMDAVNSLALAVVGKFDHDLRLLDDLLDNSLLNAQKIAADKTINPELVNIAIVNRLEKEIKRIKQATIQINPVDRKQYIQYIEGIFNMLKRVIQADSASVESVIAQHFLVQIVAKSTT